MWKQEKNDWDLYVRTQEISTRFFFNLCRTHNSPRNKSWMGQDSCFLPGVLYCHLVPGIFECSQFYYCLHYYKVFSCVISGTWYHTKYLSLGVAYPGGLTQSESQRQQHRSSSKRQTVQLACWLSSGFFIPTDLLILWYLGIFTLHGPLGPLMHTDGLLNDLLHT